jgi:transcriptional regulator with XRE-family HTH domain
MPRFGDILEELRRSRKLSQQKLAEALGWKQSKVSYLEALEEVPKEDDLRALCEFFNIRPEYFYERRDDRKPRAAAYLEQLRAATPEASPKATIALAFYSKLDRLPKHEQEQLVDEAGSQLRKLKNNRRR